LLRGQIGEAQIREEGLLERLMIENKESALVPFDELENRDIESI
jgi:hypothetical protein